MAKVPRPPHPALRLVKPLAHTSPVSSTPSHTSHIRLILQTSQTLLLELAREHPNDLLIVEELLRRLLADARSTDGSRAMLSFLFAVAGVC